MNNGTNAFNVWQNTGPIPRNQGSSPFVSVGTEDSRKLMRSGNEVNCHSNELNCHSNMPANGDIDRMKLPGGNTGIRDPMPACTGGDIARFDTYQPVNFVNYINPMAGDERSMTRKFQNMGGYDRRDCGGDDKDQQLSVISEYIEEEERFIDDDGDDDDDDDDDEDVVGQGTRHNGESNDYCRERGGMNMANSKGEKRNDFHHDLETENSPGNSSKTDSEGSKLLIIS